MVSLESFCQTQKTVNTRNHFGNVIESSRSDVRQSPLLFTVFSRANTCCTLMCTRDHRLSLSTIDTNSVIKPTVLSPITRVTRSPDRRYMTVTPRI